VRALDDGLPPCGFDRHLSELAITIGKVVKTGLGEVGALPARRVRPRSNAVERSIYFYKTDFGLDEAGHPIAGDLVPALRHIESLAWTPDGRYFDLGDDNFMCCWVDAATQRARVRLATS